MRFLHSFVPSLLLLAAGAAQAASSWSFEDGTVSVTSKKAGAGGSVKEKLNAKSPLGQTIVFDSSSTLKVLITAKENGKGKKPHQAFLVFQEPESGLEAPFVLNVKDSGKATVDITHKDIPVQLLLSTKPLRASLTIASFGSSQGYNSPVFDIEVQLDPNAPAPTYEKPIRYTKKPEIHHIFRAEEKLPPKIISLFVAAIVAATLPGLFISWLFLGANISHLPKALSAAPLSHGLFYGSIVALEGLFFLYYSSWNLFQILPPLGVVGAVTFYSGSKALGEVQSRRLAGER